MGEGSTREGWRISQVERLIDLPRRDIQRACYTGKGGAGILAPINSEWGRRLYDVEDLTRLLLVKLYKDQGYSLPEIKGIFEENNANDDASKLLDIQESRLQEQLEETEVQLNRTRLLKQAISSQGDDVHKRIEHQLRSCIAHTILERVAEDNTPSPSSKLPAFDLEDLLDTPGIDLAIDLWVGPGSYDAIVETLWEQSEKNRRNAKRSIGETTWDCLTTYRKKQMR